MKSFLGLRARLLSALAASGVAAALAAQSGCAPVITSGSGGGGAGSTSTAGTTGGGGASQHCVTDDIGTCCYSSSCYKLDELAMFTVDGVAPAECPPAANLGTNEICWWFNSGPTSTDNGICCYEMGSGDCCGRPFLVSGEARRAAVGRRADWGSPLEEASALDVETRAALGRAWAEDAQMEHASIASFARFTLHLLALGAPPSLLEGSQRAAMDEIEHARACFALATRYLGEPVGPGPMAVEGALTTVTLAEAAAASVREGCVGETLAAAVAAEQLSVTEDADARRALSRITRDEEAHAELSWLFVKWAIDAGGEAVRAAVGRAFSELLAPQRPTTTIVTETVDVGAWHRHGRLTRAEMERVKSLVEREVIAPCAQALLGLAAPLQVPESV